MNKEKILSFLILDWKNFQKNTLKILEKKSSKKSEFFNNFRTRIMEQIVNFIRLNHQIYSKNFFFFLSLDGYPISFSTYIQDLASYKSRVKKNLKIMLKIFKENFRMQTVFKEVKNLKNTFKTRNESYGYNTILFIIYNLSKKLGPVEANIFNLISTNYNLLNKQNFGINLNICKKLGCCFSFLSFRKKNLSLKFLAYFSNGFYGEPYENLVKIIHCNKFFQLILSLFWLNKFNKEFFIKAIHTKPCVVSNCLIINGNLKKCGSCGGIFKYFFSSCILCSKRFFY